MPLTAKGAQLLRDARDQILAHPDAFNMDDWDCGTTACIAGWMCRIAHIPESADDDKQLSELCGFGHIHVRQNQHPFYPLFYNCNGSESTDVKAASGRINAFLWEHGYPSEPFTASVEGSTTTEEPERDLRVLPTVDQPVSV